MQGVEILSNDENNFDMTEQRAYFYIEVANLLKEKNAITEAIDFKSKAFEFFAEAEKYQKTDFLAELACTLSVWLEE